MNLRFQLDATPPLSNPVPAPIDWLTTNKKSRVLFILNHSRVVTFCQHVSVPSVMEYEHWGTKDAVTLCLASHSLKIPTEVPVRKYLTNQDKKIKDVHFQLFKAWIDETIIYESNHHYCHHLPCCFVQQQLENSRRWPRKQVWLLGNTVKEDAAGNP